MKNNISPRLAAGLALAVALDTAIQTLWKRASAQLPQVDPVGSAAINELVRAALGNPLFYLVAVLMAAQMINWLRTLDHADVSFALPVTALSYVSVAAVSALWLAEPLTMGRVLGMVLILTGVMLVARTDPNTTKAGPDRPA